MKRLIPVLCMLLFASVAAMPSLTACSSGNDEPKKPVVKPDPEPEPDPEPGLAGTQVNEPADPMDDDHIVLAYFTSWSTGTPNPVYVTHINYAFGHVSDSFRSISIDSPDNLRKVAQLKKRSSRLKVLLSIGGWESGNFSELCADADCRKAFAADCRRVLDEYGIDGIDIDWEYPGSSVAGISSSPDDPANFVLLLREIRDVLRDGELLTLASDATGLGLRFKELLPYVDYVSIMAYDLAEPPRHHAPLYRSSTLAGHMTAAESVDKHLGAGVPAEKLVLGVPFYGRGSGVYKYSEPYSGITVRPGCTDRWDDVAKVPYITDATGAVVLGYENARSITCKRDYIKEKGLRGIMYWEYRYDDTGNTLRRAAAGMLKMR